MSGFRIENDKHIDLQTLGYIIPKGTNLCHPSHRTIKPRNGIIVYGTDTKMLYIGYENQWNPLTNIMPQKEIT
jgi:hypothetical protein